MDNIKKDAHYLKGDGEGTWGDSLALFSSVSHPMTWVKMVHLIFRWQTAGRNGDYVGRSKKDLQSDKNAGSDKMKLNIGTHLRTQ